MTSLLAATLRPVLRQLCNRYVILSAVLGIALVSGCSPRGALSVIETPSEGAAEVTLLTATGRVLSGNGAPLNRRSDHLAFHEISIVLPPERSIGEVRWGRPGHIDPEKHVTASAFHQLAGASAFRDSLRRQMNARPDSAHEVIVFVHGFNTNYSEATARVAQMAHDMNIPAVPVLFSWPSQARAHGYVHDRDSVLASRDALRRLLLEVRSAGAERILLAAHSMGAQLAMEMLVHADLARPGAAAGLADSVVLIAPDISVDVFVSQVAQILRLPKPLIVFTSAQDQALRLSTLVAGNSSRLGKPSADPRLAETGAIFLDITAFNDRSHGDFGHLTVGTSPALIALVPQLREAALALSSGASSNPGPLAETILTVRSMADTAIASKP